MDNISFDLALNPLAQLHSTVSSIYLAALTKGDLGTMNLKIEDIENDAADITFGKFGLNDDLVKAVSDLGYESPSAIQEKTIPLILDGRDIIGQAQTGTGKTAAFALPMLEKIDPKSKKIQALVLTPTRELAIQVAEAIHSYAKHLGRIRILPVYGGQSISQQIRHLRQGVQIIVWNARACNGSFAPGKRLIFLI